MKRSFAFWAGLVCFFCSSLFWNHADAAITLLHEFAGGANDGQQPQGGLILSGSTLFGMTWLGGNDNHGTIFSMNTDGSGFTLLHEFAGGADDGRYPQASLTLSGSTLFGTTTSGGDDNRGTIFSIGTDGSGFMLLHEFAGGADDGLQPQGNLILSGSTLFGTTWIGGDHDFGTVFSIDTDGSGFTLLHEFAGGADDGLGPYAGLAMSGSTLFGTTRFGGDSDQGTIFAVDTDGTEFTLLHEFAGGVGDGSSPFAGLTLSGSTLYGTATGNGDDDLGTVFSIQTDGSGFAPLREFVGGANDGAQPVAKPTLIGSTLFGTTAGGGDTDLGTAFSIGTDGSGFMLLHEFAGGANDGALPSSELIPSGSTLFGTTMSGGDHNRGTIFSITISEPLLGDLDCDEDVDFDDIDDFVLGLNNPVVYENIYGVPPTLKGDIDDDGDLDFDDIDDFVGILSGGSSHSVPEPCGIALAVLASLGVAVYQCRTAR